MAEFRYVPNVGGVFARTEAIRILNPITGGILGPFFAELSRAVEDAARAAGYTVIISSAGERAEEPDHYVCGLLERRVDELLIYSAAEVAPPVEEIARAGGPLSRRWSSTVWGVARSTSRRVGDPVRGIGGPPVVRCRAVREGAPLER